MKATLPLRAACAALILTLNACATAPPRAGTSSAPTSKAAGSDELRVFEKQQSNKAFELEQQGALRDAAMTLEILALLNPAEYGARLALLQKRIEAVARDLLEQARLAAKKGELRAAEQHYLGVVALQPQNKDAADALRGIERDRTRREFLLKPGQVMPPSPEPSGKRSAAMPANSSNPVLMEQASDMFNQGDVDEAIELLAGRLKASPNDLAARDLLADMHYKKSVGLRAGNPTAARAAAKRCLQLAPRHAACAALLGAAVKVAPASKPSSAAP